MARVAVWANAIRQTSSHPILRYGWALVATSFAACLIVVFPPLRTITPGMLFLGAVAFAVWYGGIGPGLLSAAASLVALEWMGSVAPEAALSSFLGFAAAAILLAIPISRRWTSEKQARAVAAELEHTCAELAGARQSLAAAEARYRAIGQILPFGIWVAAANGSMEYLSDSFLEFLGMGPEDCRGLGWTKALSPEDREPTLANWQRCVAAGAQWDREYRVQGADGAERTILSRGSPVRDATGEIGSWVGVHLDITDIKRHEHELAAAVNREQAARAQAEAAVRARNHVLTIVAHDLRTPLTSIKGYAQMVQRRLPEPERENGAGPSVYLGRIDDEVSRMDMTIQDLLDLAHLGTGQPLELHRGPIDLMILLSRLAEKHRVAEQPVAIHSQADSIVGDWDGTRLYRALENLISNALKYSPSDREVTVRMHVDREGEEAWAVVAVSDQGIGIPPRELPLVFEPFHRGSNVGSVDGTGMGLAGSRQIIEQHGGAISVSSELGKGTTFVVRLPLSQPDGRRIRIPAAEPFESRNGLAGGSAPARAFFPS